MLHHSELTDRDVWCLIRSQQIAVGGHRRLKIYGQLNCASGRRMKRENRVFFASPDFAKAEGYRPCGHCMNSAYREWRARKN